MLFPNVVVTPEQQSTLLVGINIFQSGLNLIKDSLYFIIVP
jgi:hypothetical protein